MTVFHAPPETSTDGAVPKEAVVDAPQGGETLTEKKADKKGFLEEVEEGFEALKEATKFSEFSGKEEFERLKENFSEGAQSVMASLSEAEKQVEGKIQSLHLEESMRHMKEDLENKIQTLHVKENLQKGEEEVEEGMTKAVEEGKHLMEEIKEGFRAVSEAVGFTKEEGKGQETGTQEKQSVEQQDDKKDS